MKNETPDIASDKMKNPNLYYIKCGKVLRMLSIDELPQLINILKGDMKFIGPRPALYNQKKLIRLRKENKIDSILPGITGWAQINGRDNLSTIQKVEFDKFYLENRSILFNCKIIFKTILKIIKMSNIKH